jgi:hypothetical protein
VSTPPIISFMNKDLREAQPGPRRSRAALTHGFAISDTATPDRHHIR